VSSTRASRIREFRLAASGDFDVYLPVGLSRLPEELHVIVRRFPRRLAAYWNGCSLRW
jgi:hypothetical protein